MLQPNVIVHLKPNSSVLTEGGRVDEIDRVAGRALFDDGPRTRIEGQNGGFVVDKEDIEEIQRL
jgi:hypothetical protein